MKSIRLKQYSYDDYIDSHGIDRTELARMLDIWLQNLAPNDAGNVILENKSGYIVSIPSKKADFFTG